MFGIYLGLELLCILAVLLSTLFSFDFVPIDLVRYLPITINFIFALLDKMNKKITIALLFSLLADFFFLHTDLSVLGISLYIGTQLFYRFFLKDKVDKKLLSIAIINILVVLVTKDTLKVVEGILYACLFFSNIILTFRRQKLDKRFTILLVSLIFLAMCDTCIIIKMLTKDNILYTIFDLIEWTMYIISQITLVTFAHKNTREKSFPSTTF